MTTKRYKDTSREESVMTMTIKRTIDLDTLHLTSGAHNNAEEGMCVMEAAAYLAGEPFSDHPACVSPVIAAFCRAWNDAPEPYGQPIRDRLRVSLPRLIGTRGDAAQEKRRGWLALDWLIRVHLSAWLEVAGLHEHAETMRSLPPQTSETALEASQAAWDAAWDAAGDAAWDAAGDAAGDAAWAAARDAARDAARAAAWAAAWDAAGDAAGDAVRDAAWAAAWDAAWAAVWAAASDAARDALAPTVEELQASAWQLLDALIECD